MKLRRSFLKGVVPVASMFLLGVLTTPSLAGGAAATAAPVTATFGSRATPGLLAAGRQGSAASIPWSEVGPGWLLAEWLPTAPKASGAANPTSRATLFLIDPLGGRYAIATPGVSPSSYLAAWSGDGKRALFEAQTNSVTSSVVTVLQLQTGRSTTFAIASDGPRSIAFTEPDGLAVIAGNQVQSNGTIPMERFDLNGALAYSYPAAFPQAGSVEGGALYSPDGTELVLGTARGLEVVTNGGQPVRYLPARRGAGTCQPIRWWTWRLARRPTVSRCCGWSPPTGASPRLSPWRQSVVRVISATSTPGRSRAATTCRTLARAGTSTWPSWARRGGPPRSGCRAPPQANPCTSWGPTTRTWPSPPVCRAHREAPR